MLTVHATADLTCDGPAGDGECKAPPDRVIPTGADSRSMHLTAKTISKARLALVIPATKIGWRRHPRMRQWWLCPACAETFR